MQRSGGAVIPMQLNFDQIKFAVGDQDTVVRMQSGKARSVFSEDAIQFLNELSKILIRTGKAFSDVVTFGFWCRRAALMAEKAKYDDVDQRIGKGVVFHIAPSNVPVNFAFSFAAGLLAGNANIVRIPSKDFEQVQIICDAVNQLLQGEFSHMADYLCMVRYPAAKENNDLFSAICNTRVIWGGDGTIAEIRKSPLKPRANEITFADRYSVAVIDADAYLAADDKESIAQAFYNDTFFSDQNACTAPRLIIWLGAQKNEAKEIFWQKAHDYAYDKYELAPVQAVGKLTALDKVAADRKVSLIHGSDNLIYRVFVEQIDEALMDYRYNSGFFFEYDADSLNELALVAGERCQTVTYYGVSMEQFRACISSERMLGIDRIVPIGKSMDFALIWDGHDLIREMSRRIEIH